MKELLSSLGPVCAIIGAQWGDEGKGKVTDILAEHYDIIARACGGANAGHTIVIGGQKHVFHLLPSGCLHEGKEVIIGAGTVLHLPTLLEEIQLLRDAGIDVIPRLRISPEAHIVLEYHKDMDAALEAQRTQNKGQGIGTTKRGIGPAYMDKACRTGIRMEQLGQDLRSELTSRRDVLQKMFDITVDVDAELASLADAASVLQPCIADTIDILHDRLAAGKSVLIEGAQATMLDIDHGTYPYVTSSSTTVAGALQGLGLAPSALTSCIGVVKAYCTRVGSGPFLTELDGADAERIRERGGEYGATTGRPRRTGWLHLPDITRAARINGFTHWNFTKLDVLDEEETIPVGVTTEQGVQVTYENLPGWQQSTVGLTNYDDLPENARRYIEFIESKTGIPCSLIGTGQGREEMIAKA